ncbi:MAG TPA: hypothetical protein VKB46_07035 [Pyrinomonadaceae bacterium]|nr:hypothetical protein [Pyrinomonadaceae bacterium]
MSARISVIFYIILCIEIGIFLTVLPWWPQGMWGLSDWGNNYFLLYAARKIGSQQLVGVVASGWVRGAVTGVGLLNLGIAFWEIFHFKQTVQALQRQTSKANTPKNDAAQASSTNYLSDNERRDDQQDHS